MRQMVAQVYRMRAQIAIVDVAENGEIVPKIRLQFAGVAAPDNVLLYPELLPCWQPI